MPPVSLVFAWAFSTAMTGAVLAAALSQPSAENGMAFYGSYHQNGWNQLIHFFGVPAILYSAIVFGCHLTIPAVKLPGVLFLLPKHDFSMGTFWTLFYVTYYLTIDPIGGTLFGAVLVGMYATGVNWYLEDQKKAGKGNPTPSWTGTGAVLKWALWVQLASWYSQIHPGHAVLEGAKPALLDSLGGSFSSAPLFAFYDGVWFLGFRTELRDRVQGLVLEHTKELCQTTGAAMRVCQSLQ